jgi:hypothetical protein
MISTTLAHISCGDVRILRTHLLQKGATTINCCRLNSPAFAMAMPSPASLKCFWMSMAFSRVAS